MRRPPASAPATACAAPRSGKASPRFRKSVRQNLKSVCVPRMQRSALAVRCWSGVHIEHGVFVTMGPGSAEQREGALHRVRDTPAATSPGNAWRALQPVIASEAKQSINLTATTALDCFVGFAPCNDVACFRFKFQTAEKVPRRHFARGFAFSSALERERAQGRPGARCTRGLVCKFT
jgi:hypothetical protein